MSTRTPLATYQVVLPLIEGVAAGGDTLSVCARRRLASTCSDLPAGDAASHGRFTPKANHCQSTGMPAATAAARRVLTNNASRASSPIQSNWP